MKHKELWIGIGFVPIFLLAATLAVAVDDSLEAGGGTPPGSPPAGSPNAPIGGGCVCGTIRLNFSPNLFSVVTNVINSVTNVQPIIELGLQCCVTGRVWGGNYGGVGDTKITCSTVPDQLAAVGLNCGMSPFVATSTICTNINTNVCVMGLTAGVGILKAELWLGGNPCPTDAIPLVVVNLLAATGFPQVVSVDSNVIFTAVVDPPGYGGRIIKWSGGGTPSEGSGLQFTTRWSDPGRHVVTAHCGNAMDCGTWASATTTVIKVDFTKLWETPNKANQIFNPTRKDDPVNSSQQPDSNGDTYGVPRNYLYLVPDPADSKYKATVEADIQPDSIRTKIIAATYAGSGKVSGSDKAFDANGKCDIEFSHTGSDIQNFTVRVGFDANNNSQLDQSEILPFVVKNSTTGQTIDDPTIRGSSESIYQTSQNEVDWIITSPLTAIPLKHARQFLRIFRDGNFANVPTDIQPSSYDYDSGFNCFSGLFCEWLTHNSGAGFNDAGTAGIWHYTWDETKSVAELVGNSLPVVDPVDAFYWSTVYPQVVTDFQGQPVGYQKTYPSPTTSYDIPHTHESPAWVTTTTVTFANFPEFLANGDDLNGTIGRGRLISHKAQFTVEKKDIGYIVLDVIEVRSVGEVQDLYDFNHDAGGAAQNAAILQIGHGNGSYGSARSQGHIWRNTVNFDITYDHLP